MQKTDLMWEDVTERADKVVQDIIIAFPKSTRREPLRIYPVPRGGIPAALIVLNRLSWRNVNAILVEDMGSSNLAVDDIVDTGKTRDDYCEGDEHDGIFFALVDKTTSQDKDIGWAIFPWERMRNEGTGPAENVRRLLEFIGEDPEREGLVKTPERVIKSYKTLYGGYEEDGTDTSWVTFSDDPTDEMVILRDIEFYSTCEHHMLPFFGRAHIAYIPNKKIIGISKLARILEKYARRLQIQERLCKQVTGCIDTVIAPQGAACVLKAQHFCMTSRGVQKQNSIMVTSSLTGVFRTDAPARSEFMSMIK